MVPKTEIIEYKEQFTPYCSCGHLLRQVTKFDYHINGENADKFICEGCGKTVFRKWKKKNDTI